MHFLSWNPIKTETPNFHVPEFFGEIKPAATMVEVSKLISPEILVEIEFSAVAE
jgi:enamine deaminase RidA (YjgF/YER057c/UK114 family)